MLDDDDSAAWHQLETEQRRREADELLANDPGYSQWIESYDRETERQQNMDMTKYAGSESKYLKAADLQGKTVKVRIAGVSLLEFEDDSGSKSQKPALSLAGKEKQVVCNATSVGDLIQAFGADSDAWVGKEIRLSTKHYPKFGRDGIVITPIEDAQAVSDVPF